MATSFKANCIRASRPHIPLRARPPVCALISLYYPAAVRWLIISIHVDPIDRMQVGWPGPHILKKHLKRFLPSLAHGNSATTIRSICMVRWTTAALPHRHPHMIFWTLRLEHFLYPAFSGARARLEYRSPPETISRANNPNSETLRIRRCSARGMPATSRECVPM